MNNSDSLPISSIPRLTVIAPIIIMLRAKMIVGVFTIKASFINSANWRSWLAFISRQINRKTRLTGLPSHLVKIRSLY
ncbi:hypothetical protein D3C84_975170 [compost metagenome]